MNWRDYGSAGALWLFVCAVGAQDIPPTITQQPQIYPSQTVLVDTALYFEVVVDVNSTQPLSYQWRFKGVNIPGANGNVYFLYSARTNDTGAYSVVVTNIAGKVTSSNAILTVLIPPTITTNPVSKSVKVGTSVTFSVRATGTPPLTYQWFHDYEVIPWGTSRDLTITNAQPSDEGDYWAEVSNVAVTSNLTDAAISEPATLTVNIPPSITAQPESQVAIEGDFVQFEVVAEGTEPLSYQWRCNGTAIPDETDIFLFLPSVESGDAGTYSVVVTNLAGKVTSSNAILTVLVPPAITLQPTNKTVRVGSNVTFTVRAIGTPPLSFQWWFDTEPIPGATSSNLSFVVSGPEQAGDYSVTVSNTTGADLVVESDIASLTVVEDVKPTVVISLPADGARWSNAVLTVSGTASDNAQVVTVWYQLNGGGWTNAVGTTNWTASGPVIAGTNTFRVYCVDTSTNYSANVERRYFYVVPSLLTVITNGPGSVTPYASGQYLEVGAAYTNTAQPGVGFAFTGWSGGVSSTNPVLKFIMQSNLVLQASFVDVQRPEVAVTNPPPGGRLTNAVAEVSGTASDNWVVVQVWYQLNSGQWSVAEGTNQWRAVVTLAPRTNVFRVYSVDAAGNNSLTNATTTTVTLLELFAVGLRLTGNVATISFTSVTGKTYNLEYKRSLNDSIWASLSNTVSGVDDVLELSDPNAPPTNRFYRVHAQ